MKIKKRCVQDEEREIINTMSYVILNNKFICFIATETLQAFFFITFNTHYYCIKAFLKCSTAYDFYSFC